jgi:TnpA family transposase
MVDAARSLTADGVCRTAPAQAGEVDVARPGCADYNAKYGSEPGVKFYTHISDRYAPFHTKVIAANASEAAHILDGLLHHECSLEVREHYTDTAGAIDHVFGLCHLLGFRFARRTKARAPPNSMTAPRNGLRRTKSSGL